MSFVCVWCGVASSFEDGAKVNDSIANFLGYGIAAGLVEKSGDSAATVKLESVGFQCGLNSIVGTFGSGGVPIGLKRAEAGFAFADVGDQDGVCDDGIHDIFRFCVVLCWSSISGVRVLAVRDKLQAASDVGQVHAHPITIDGGNAAAVLGLGLTEMIFNRGYRWIIGGGMDGCCVAGETVADNCGAHWSVGVVLCCVAQLRST